MIQIIRLKLSVAAEADIQTAAQVKAAEEGERIHILPIWILLPGIQLKSKLEAVAEREQAEEILFLMIKVM